MLVLATAKPLAQGHNPARNRNTSQNLRFDFRVPGFARGEREPGDLRAPATNIEQQRVGFRCLRHVIER